MDAPTIAVAITDAWKRSSRVTGRTILEATLSSRALLEKLLKMTFEASPLSAA